MPREQRHSDHFCLFPLFPLQLLSTKQAQNPHLGWVSPSWEWHNPSEQLCADVSALDGSVLTCTLLAWLFPSPNASVDFLLNPPLLGKSPCPTLPWILLGSAVVTPIPSKLFQYFFWPLLSLHRAILGAFLTSQPFFHCSFFSCSFWTSSSGTPRNF